jgi:hypothetical protein
MKLKQEEEKLKILKNMIKKEQDELNIKRIVWKEMGVVGEFETYKQYNYNQMDLNILLHDLGLLQLITFIKSEELSEEDMEQVKHIHIPRKNYLKFYPCKDLKKETTAPLFSCNIEQASMIEKVRLWKEAYDKFVSLKMSWERERARARISSEWKFSRKANFECGSLSIFETPIRYRTDKVFHILGTEKVLSKAKVDLEKIVEYTARGFLRKQEVNKLRKVIDVKRRYLLMTIQKENQKRENWYFKLKHLSKISQIYEEWDV